MSVTLGGGPFPAAASTCWKPASINVLEISLRKTIQTRASRKSMINLPEADFWTASLKVLFRV